MEADAHRLDVLVARGEIDVALCRTPAQLPQGLRFEPVLKDRFAVVAGCRHAGARRRRPSLDQVRRRTWLAMPTGSAARKRFDALFADGDPPPLCQVSSREPMVLWAMLRAQPLLALVPASAVRPLIAIGELEEMSIERRLEMEPIGALSRQDEDRAGVSAFLRALQPVRPME